MWGRSAVGSIARTRDEACRFHAFEQAGYIWHAGQKPVTDLVSAEAARSGPAQDAEHVELGRGDDKRRELLLDGVGEQARRSDDAEERLLFRRLEGRLLAEIGRRG